MESSAFVSLSFPFSLHLSLLTKISSFWVSNRHGEGAFCL
jgi:hypothetical protein